MKNMLFRRRESKNWKIDHSITIWEKAKFQKLDFFNLCQSEIWIYDQINTRINENYLGLNMCVCEWVWTKLLKHLKRVKFLYLAI